MPNPPTSSRVPVVQLSLLATSAVLIVISLVQIFFRTPADANLGIVQKIFYWHVGGAFAMLLAFVAAALASLLDLLSPNDRLDAVARATLETGVLFALFVVTSGPLWARKSWGTYWTWEPRLTLTLLVLLLALAVLAIRRLSADSATGRKVGAALAVLGAPTSGLIHIAVKKWGGTHPTVIQGGGINSADMRLSFWLSVAALLTLATVLVITRYKQLRTASALAELRLDLSGHALDAGR